MQRARSGEHGQTMAEYAIVLMVITIVTLAAFTLIGDTSAAALDELLDFFS